MTKAEEILAKYPSVKLGLDEHYGKQTVLNALNEALRIHDVVGRSEQLVCPDCKHNARMQNGFIWCENDDCGGIYRAN